MDLRANKPKGRPVFSHHRCTIRASPDDDDGDDDETDVNDDDDDEDDDADVKDDIDTR